MSIESTPVVFESGVIRFDEDGVLYVHLTHGPDAPHPLLIQEVDDAATLPPTASEVSLVGTGDGSWKARAALPEALDLPRGFVFRLEKWGFAQIEMSGDLSVLVENPASLPPWFSPGRVHRLDGPDGGVRIWRGSAPPPSPPERAPSWEEALKTPASEQGKPAPEWSQGARPPRSKTGGDGCVLLALGVPLLLGLGALSGWLPG